MPASQDHDVASPCIQICRINDSGTCVGCSRRLEEIAEWGYASADRKRAILEEVQQRQRQRKSTELS